MTQQTLIIGDLHGCVDEAEELIRRAQLSPDDRIIFLGDLVDRGPAPAACIDLVMAIEHRQGSLACVLGNHEERHLEYRRIELTRGKVDVPHPNHVATRQQLRDEHYEYLSQLPLYIRLPEHNAVCVHAGVFPNRAIEAQDPRHLLHVQMLNPYVIDESGSGDRRVNERSIWAKKVPKEEAKLWKFWTRLWTGPETVIFGHSVLDRPLITDKAIGLDGGCCFGHELWGIVLPARRIIRVKSRTGVKKDTASSPIRIHGKVKTY